MKTVATCHRFGRIFQLGFLAVWLAWEQMAVGQSPTADTFNPGVSDVSAIAVQPDGRIVLGMSSLTGGGRRIGYLGRLYADGSVDAEFSPQPSSGVSSILLQPDGRIVIGGQFWEVAGLPRVGVARLATDGFIETAFEPVSSNTVSSMLLQADGKIILNRAPFRRLNADGTADTTFSPATNYSVVSMALQPDGRILIGGYYELIPGQEGNVLARLEANGALDVTFNPQVNKIVFAILPQPDGKIVIGGMFTSVGGQPRTNLARINADGTLDAAFNTSVVGNYVALLALQTDGQIVVAGNFDSIAGQPIQNLARLNPDGSLDSAFNPGSGSVYSLALQPDGALVVAGYFGVLGGQVRTNLGRLFPTHPATQSLINSGTTITWLRGGSSPEVWRTTFETSTNWMDWITVGPGSRIPGGWELAGQSLPANATVRARGFVSDARGGSSWFAETTTGTPFILTHPASRTNQTATVATFNVTVVGAEPLNFVWRKNGVSLSNAGNVFGATTATLILTNVLGADRGDYSVVVSNVSGVVTSSVAQLTVMEPIITAQPASQSVSPGDAAVFGVSAVGSAPLNYVWLRNGAPVAGAIGPTLTLTNVQTADAGDAVQVVVSNAFGVATSTVVRLTVNLVTPDAFNPGAKSSSSAYVYTTAVQADGRVVFAGDFNQPRSYVARVHADGAFDTNFNLGTDWVVQSAAIQPDGKIALAGWFNSIGGQTHDSIARLNGDGSVDSFFSPSVYFVLYSLALPADGKILIGGEFTWVNGAIRTNLARLEGSAGPDQFNPGAMGNSWAIQDNGRVWALGTQPDGKILAGGNFTILGGQARTNLGRLHADGTLDNSFRADATGTSYPAVYSLGVEPDGQILVGGDFSSLSGQACSNFGRLNPDGSRDQTFNVDPDGLVFCHALQADGRILIGGNFKFVTGQPRAGLARLQPDGSLDFTFNPGISGTEDPGVHTLSLQDNGDIIVGGRFDQLGGQWRTNIGRLVNTGPAAQSLTFNGTSATWLRGGTGPEVWRTSFAYSTNGFDWSEAGAGNRIPGGWQLSGAALPTNGIVRGRGFVSGSSEGSSWFVETILGRPFIISQPTNRTNNAGTTATFSVSTVGGPASSYQWRKNETNLPNGGNISGATSPTLVLENVLGADAALYSSVVSNGYGVATSSVAALTVREPIILTQPSHLASNPGSNITFSVIALGTEPLAYQWRKERTPLPGANLATLNLAGVQGTNAGSYDVVVTSSFGSVTSAPAMLSVNQAGLDTLISTVNNSVRAFAVQPDGRILIGGDFTTLGGVTRRGVARFNADGTLDPSFNPNPNSGVYAILLQPEGKTVLGGAFTTVGLVTRNRLARLNADGSLDSTFNPNANGIVACLALQPDGKLLACGHFTSLAGQSRAYLARLQATGALDTSFNAAANSPVNTLTVQPDGEILVGGAFTTLNGASRRHIARLTSSGAVDSAFNAVLEVGGGGVPGVYSLLVQPDNKILVAGAFSSLDSTTRTNLGRLNADGSLDTAFRAGADDLIWTLALQADGSFLAAGNFGALNGIPRAKLGRFNPDGSLDARFNPAANGMVRALAVQTDGRILVGGDFTTVNGQVRSRFGRLQNTAEASSNLAFDGSTLTWLRGGASPEVWRTELEITTNTVSWSSLGSGARIPGGWQFTNFVGPTNAVLRTRGYLTGGAQNSSGWSAEQAFATFPQIPPILSASYPAAPADPFGLVLSGVAGQIVVTEGSTNLTAWLPIATNLISVSPVIVSDSSATQFPVRFYRARLWP